MLQLLREFNFIAMAVTGHGYYGSRLMQIFFIYSTYLILGKKTFEELLHGKRHDYLSTSAQLIIEYKNTEIETINENGEKNENVLPHSIVDFE